MDQEKTNPQASRKDGFSPHEQLTKKFVALLKDANDPNSVLSITLASQRFDTPEKRIREAVRRNLNFVIAKALAEMVGTLGLATATIQLLSVLDEKTIADPQGIQGDKRLAARMSFLSSNEAVVLMEEIESASRNLSEELASTPPGGYGLEKLRAFGDRFVAEVGEVVHGIKASILWRIEFIEAMEKAKMDVTEGSSNGE